MQLEKNFNTFSQNGMVLDETSNQYKLDETELSVKIERFEEDLKTKTGIQKTDVKNALKRFEEDMSHLRIPKDELEHYLRTTQAQKSILDYQEIKNRFRYALIEADTENRPDVLYTTEFQPKKSHNQITIDTRQVLNKRNPFADIQIKNQQFLYLDNDVYKTLSFTTGHTLTKLQVNDEEILALQPGFKISKTHERTRVRENMPILMDDTITTPLPETSGDRELIYI